MALNRLQQSSKLRALLLSSIFYLLSSLFAHAQAPGFRVEVQTQFFQYFSWESDGNALRYEVEIERDENGVFRQYLLESTTALYIAVSLSPGNFRYRVIPFDLLDRPGRITQWVHFEVRPAISPELDRFSPDNFVMGSRQVYTLNLYGNNILPGGEIFLENLFGDIIFPAEVLFLHNNQAQLSFTCDQLIAGVYQINVRNPGGLESRIRGFVIYAEGTEGALPSPFAGIFLGASWMTKVNLSGESHPAEELLSGAALNLGITSFGLNFFDIGLELLCAFYSQSLLLESNFLLRKNLLNRKMAVTFRAGIGFIMPITFDNAFIYINTGLSFLWQPFDQRVLNLFYLEAGVNYLHLFTPGDLSGSLRPWIGMGARMPLYRR